MVWSLFKNWSYRPHRQAEKTATPEQLVTTTDSEQTPLHQALPDLVCRLRNDGTFLEASPNAELVAYFDTDKPVGKPASEIFSATVTEQLMLAIRSVLAGYSPARFEYDASPTVGKRHFEASIVPAHNPYELLCIIRDITGNKLTATRLQRQQQALLHLSTDPILEQGQPRPILQLISKTAATTLDTARATIWFYSHEQQQLSCLNLYQRGSTDQQSLPSLKIRDYPHYFTALQKHRVLVINDTRSDSRSQELFPKYLQPLGISSLLDAPIRRHGQLVGSIRLEHIGNQRQWSQDEQQFAASIADVITLVLEQHEHRQAQQHIADSKQELQDVLRNMQDTYYRTDQEGRLIRISDSVEKLLGYSPEDLLGRHMASLYVDADGRDKFMAALQSSHGMVNDYQAALKHRDGHDVWVSTNAHYYRDADGEILGVEGTTRDISEQHRTYQQMDILSSALQQTADTVMVTDANAVIVYVNPAFETITGYRCEEVIGKNPNILNSNKMGPDFFKRLWSQIKNGNAFSDLFINKRKDGELYYEEKTITPLLDRNGHISYFVATGKDITERMETQERLRFLAHHDVLTELPNRSLLMDRLEQALARASWHEHRVAILFMDVDRFKNINDTLGHDAGDELLMQLSKRLNNNVRGGDTVARLGGDDFIILIDDINNESDIAHLAEKLLATLNNPFNIQGHELYVTASIGISIYPNDADDGTTLLRNADIAMYRAKELGKNNFQFYSNDMSIRALERMTLENSLRQAVEQESFELHYQAQVDLKTRRIIGVEALLRWHHPVLGFIQPKDFIPLLEETGLIVPIGRWILHNACEQSRRWHDAGWKYLHMSVNVSSRQFNDPDFIHSVTDIIEQTGVNPEFLELELTESMLMRNTSIINNTFTALSQLGIRFAIDDFGTGYSSLSYLRRFPIDTLKIDRSFVRDIAKDNNDSDITAATLALGRSLSLNVIAEGVESEEQLQFLREHGCHMAQGYLFHHPANAVEMTEMLIQQDQMRMDSPA